MSEQVKVFKNVQTQTATGAAHDVALVTTTASQQAVIKDINIKGAEIATVALDGFELMGSTTADSNLVASGSLIMGPSSTLALKFPATRAVQTQGFFGMFFSNGTDTCNYMVGTGVQAANGLSTELTSSTSLRTDSSLDSDDACVSVDPTTGVASYWRMRSDYLTRFDGTSGSPVSSISFGSSSYGICTDNVYIYATNSASFTALYRHNIATGANDTVNLSVTIYGRQGNQGSGMEYHNGLIYTKQEGGSQNTYVYDMAKDTVTTFGNGNVGSYSDGFGLTTNLAGETFLVEQGPDSWWWYSITQNVTGGVASGSATHGSGTSGSSTEYGNGMVEVAPGILYCFQEQSDDMAIFDLNVSPPTRQEITNATSRNASVYNNYGNAFAVAGYVRPFVDTVKYDALVSGVLITDGV